MPMHMLLMYYLKSQLNLNVKPIIEHHLIKNKEIAFYNVRVSNKAYRNISKTYNSPYDAYLVKFDW